MELLVTGLLGGIGAALIAFFLAYPKAKAELQAQYQTKFENMAFLVREEFEKAREQEAGKRSAIHADVENVLNEVRLVTKETELIRTEIGTNVWTRERVWEQKRDVYFEILKCVNEHLDTLTTLHAYRQGVWQGSRRQGINLSVVAPIPNQIDDLMRAYIASHKKLSNVLRVAYLFVDPMAYPLLNECTESGYFGKAFGQLDAKRGHFDRTVPEQIEIQEKGTQEMKFLGGWMSRVVVCARQDLDVDPGTAARVFNKFGSAQ